METIKFSKLTNFTGRNGFFMCSGVEVMETGAKDQIIISPLTSRGQVGRCDIFIPKADIPALIEMLSKYKEKTIIYDESYFQQGHNGPFKYQGEWFTRDEMVLKGLDKECKKAMIH